MIAQIAMNTLMNVTNAAAK